MAIYANQLEVIYTFIFPEQPIFYQPKQATGCKMALLEINCLFDKDDENLAGKSTTVQMRA